MLEPHIINLIVYETLLIPIIFFSVLYYIVAFGTLKVKMQNYKFRHVKDDKLPTVTIQIPVYNDPVAVRCIKKCLAFDYPKNKIDIIIADDSTDEMTTKIIKNFIKNEKRVRLVKRKSREGFKPGALNNILPMTKGELIVIFDSDFVPKKDFLRKLVAPFLSDEKIAVVQSRMGFVNYDHNTVSRFAGALLMIYHHCIMPLSSRFNTVFFCGTGGAIRTSVLRSLGGWNTKSITEDADLSVLLLEKGYKNLYIPNLYAAGEVPFTLKSFLRQQMRWAYGITRVFMDHWRKIFFSKNFTIGQRGMMIFITAGYVVTPFVAAIAFSGQLGWIITPPKPLTILDVINFLKIFLYTSGFIFLGAIALRRGGKFGDFIKLLAAAFVLGIILAFTNMIAFLKAITGRKEGWIRTPKMGSLSILEFFRKIFGYKETLKT